MNEHIIMKSIPFIRTGQQLCCSLTVINHLQQTFFFSWSYQKTLYDNNNNTSLTDTVFVFSYNTMNITKIVEFGYENAPIRLQGKHVQTARQLLTASVKTW